MHVTSYDRIVAFTTLDGSEIREWAGRVSAAGTGRLRVDGEERDLRAGDCALIPPGARHKIVNTGDEPLRIVCACAPAYSDADTVLTEDPPRA